VKCGSPSTALEHALGTHTHTHTHILSVAAARVRFPSAAALGPTLGVHTETVLDVLALCGMLLSALSLALPCWRIAPVYIMLHMMCVVAPVFAPISVAGERTVVFVDTLCILN
jgi:hypothetical protein